MQQSKEHISPRDDIPFNFHWLYTAAAAQMMLLAQHEGVAIALSTQVEEVDKDDNMYHQRTHGGYL